MSGDRQTIQPRASGLAASLVTVGFCWRAWIAHATFFNTDEAWHFSLANQNSLYLAYKSSLTVSHPPLLILILHFWRVLGTSNLVLRLPCVIAGTLFCWVFWRWLTLLAGHTAGWVGLILVTFLPPMIALSADLRQYTLMLFFAVGAAYSVELALAKDSTRRMVISTAFLYLALLSHYSAFLFAAALAAYCILRVFKQGPSTGVIAVWVAGQIGGVAIGAILYVTQISKLGAVYQGAQPLRRYADWYLADWYFHPGRDHLLPFLYHGTFGLFRFVFGQTIIGEIATLLFVAGILILLLRKAQPDAPPFRLIGIFLVLPFILNCAAVASGLYPYGRTRQCVFLAIFAIAGVSVALAAMARSKAGLAVAAAALLVFSCHAFGTLQGRDMLPLAEQRQQHMDDALWFLGHAAKAGEIVFTDKATSFQLGHYLCEQKPYIIDHAVPGYESFECNGFRVVSSELIDGPLLPETFGEQWPRMIRAFALKPGTQVWIVQGGWGSGLGENLRDHFAEFSSIQPHAFGRYIDIFCLTVAQPAPGLAAQR